MTDGDGIMASMGPRDLLDTATVRRIAVQADADPRSVDRVITGMPTRHSVRARIVKAMAELNIRVGVGELA